MRTMVRAIAVLSLLTLPAGFLYAGTNPSKARPATSAKAKPEVDHGSARHLSRADASSTPRLEELGRGPLRFEANAGQFASEVRFVSRGMSHTLFLTPNEAVLALPGRPIGPQSPEPFSRLAPQLQHSEGAVARLRSSERMQRRKLSARICCREKATTLSATIPQNGGRGSLSTPGCVTRTSIRASIGSITETRASWSTT